MVTAVAGSATPSGVAGVSRAAGVVLTVETPEPDSFGLDIGLVVGAALTFVLAYIVARAAAVVLRNTSELTVEHRIAIKSFIPVIRFAVYVVAVVVVVGPLFEVTTSQLLAFSGALGAILGLGIQKLFANVVGGFVVVFQRPYRPGDKIQIGEHYGEVTDIGISSTTLLTVDDDEVLVPNYKFFTESVANANAGDAELMIVPEVYLAHGADIERGREILRDVMRSSRYVYVSDGHPLVVRVDHDPAYVTLRGRAYVNDVRREFAFKSDVTERTLATLDEEGIERPDVAAVPGGGG